MRRRSLILGASLALLVLGGCADDGGGEASASSPTETPEPTATAEPSESPTAEGGRDDYATPDETPSPTRDRSGETEVEAEDSALGTILTDSDGVTLYVFLNDADGESTCYDSCQENWPPLVARGEVEARDGVDASLLATTERRDGTMQVTYAGLPLYYFAGDQSSGDTNGQGVGGVWFVVSPEGGPIEG